MAFDKKFVAAARKCALRNAVTEPKTLEGCFQTDLAYVDPDTYAEVSDILAHDTPAGPKAALGQDNSMALHQVHFVYMDVGCWAGAGGKDGWTKHREFGVVYGHLAVLCGFAKDAMAYSRYANAPMWAGSGSLKKSATIDPTVVNYPEWPRVDSLLGALRDAIPGLYLFILGATTVSSGYAPVPPVGDKEPIMVFLGDLHAPAVTGSSNAHIVENGQEMLKGRLDVNVPEFASPIPVSAPTGVAVDNPFVRQATWYANQAASRLDWHLATTYETVEKWVGFYHGKGEKGADIFQDAGRDLRSFVEALASFHRDGWPLEVIQLGDFFDLWLGFQRGFNTNIDDVYDNASAMEFARFWVQRSLFASDQGAHLIHLLTLTERAGKNAKTGAALKTHFLYGNHDNYRKRRSDSAIEVPAGREHTGMRVHAFHAPAFFEKQGLWAEHGHQSDEANCDESPATGHGATQAAFFEPSIRNLEGPLGWLASSDEDEKLQRVVHIHHAMEKCFLNHLTDHSKPAKKPEPCRGIYVMGHTHEPMLKRVQLRHAAPQGKAKG